MSGTLETIRYELARLRREVMATRALLLPVPPLQRTIEAASLAEGVAEFLEKLDGDLKNLEGYVGEKNGH